MQEDEEGNDRLQDGHKKLKKPHWRAKLFSKDEKTGADDTKTMRINQDVSNFLGSSSQNPQLRFPSQKPAIPPPRIDVSISQRWPNPHDVVEVGSNDSRRPSVELDTFRKRRKPRREGLKVSFTDQQPDVIGEGGDNAELPPREILRSRSKHSFSTSGSRRADEGRPLVKGYGASAPEEDMTQNEDNFQPSILVRAPSGLPESQATWPNLQQDSHASLQPQPNNRSEPSRTQSSAERMRAKMRAEEGLIFQQGIREPSPAAASRIRQDSASMPKRPGPSPLPSQDQVVGEMANYSLRPIPAPAVQPPPHNNLPSENPPLNSNFANVGQPPSYEPFAASSDPTTTQGSNSEQLPPLEDKAPSRSLRSAAQTFSEDALGDFASRVDRYGNLFSLSAESVKPVMETSLSEWIRCSVWWFLKGRAELESFIRSRPREPIKETNVQSSPFQAFADLAKALWINQHIIPQHPELKSYGNMSTASLVALVKNLGEKVLSAQLEIHQKIIANLRALTMSMKRNNILVPSESGLPQGLDTSIWIKYPNFTPEVMAVFSGSISKSIILEAPRHHVQADSIMPLGDTTETFCFARMFVNLWLTSEDQASQPIDILCLLSVLRDRNVWGITVAIASQSELVNIVLQPDGSEVPTWNDVHWSTRSHSMRVRMPLNFELSIQFLEQDFKMLWNIVDYTRKTEEGFKPEAGETLVFENVTSAFQYIDSSPNRLFPPEPSKRCRVRIFERTANRSEGFGQMTLHRGFRLIAVSSPKIKTLSSVGHVLGKGVPIVFSYLRGDDGAPAFMIKTEENGRKARMILSFHDPAERTELHTLLTGGVVDPEETETQSLSLSAFSLTLRQNADDTKTTMAPLAQLQWQSVRVVGRRPEALIRDPSLRALKGSLRVCMDAKSGTLTDRVTAGPGELQINLNLNNQTALTILRTAQEDITLCLVENTISKELPEAAARALEMIAKSSTIRTYQFTTLSDMHTFEQALTGFSVLFDGVASNLAISRRRMVVPIYKRWEVSLVRIQILRQDKVTQFVAFFEDFAHGECMNFHIKSTDAFETFARSGKYYVRIVDAKFALPKGEEDATRSFVCLDMPEYPGEHDDITIAFDTESDRARLQEILPAAVKEASRINALRK